MITVNHNPGSKYFYLSSFYPCSVPFHGQTFRNAEAAFQAQKCLDLEEKRSFESLSAKEAKLKGNMVSLRRDWEQVKDEIMYQVCYSKFVNNSIIARKLIRTSADILVTNTWFDTYWGVCGNIGLNKLGELLVKIREKMREIYK